jgi:hypothetical protein
VKPVVTTSRRRLWDGMYSHVGPSVCRRGVASVHDDAIRQRSAAACSRRDGSRETSTDSVPSRRVRAVSRRLGIDRGRDGDGRVRNAHSGGRCEPEWVASGLMCAGCTVILDASFDKSTPSCCAALSQTCPNGLPPRRVAPFSLRADEMRRGVAPWMTVLVMESELRQMVDDQYGNTH